MLGDLWDNLIEIGTIPFKLGGKLVDDFTGTRIEDWVNSTKDVIKIKNNEKH